MQLLTFNAPLQIQAKENNSPRVDILAYSGGLMTVGIGLVVVDLAGMTIPAQVPLLTDHDNALNKIAGQGQPAVKQGKLFVSGNLAAASEAGKQILELHRSGFAFQASLGAEIQSSSRLQPGDVLQVNGQKITVPPSGAILVSKSQLREVSLVAMGADSSTSVSIAAAYAARKSISTMNHNTTTNDSNLQPAQLVIASNTVPQAQPMPGDGAQLMANNTPASVLATRQQHTAEAAELGRIQYIKTRITDPNIQATAIAQAWDHNAVDLHVLRASRPVGPAVHMQRDAAPDVLTASMCLTAGISPATLAKSYGEQVVNAAMTKEYRGMSIQGLMMKMIHAAGLSVGQGRFGQDHIRMAFEADRTLRASFSNMSLPGMLGAVANKALLEVFDAMTTVWPLIAHKTDAGDFKKFTRYRLVGKGKFEKVGPDGELKHISLDERGYDNQIATSGAIVSCTRQDIINDDLGALTQLPRILGRLGAVEVEKAVVGAIRDAGSFFSSGNGNLITGAATGLSIESLTSAEQKFLKMKDENGDPILASIKNLLVPTALKTLAMQLMSTQQLVGTTTADKLLPSANPHAGRYTPAASPFLDADSGGSDKAWYLFADPNIMPAVEVAFLNGVENPTIESGETDFATLGIQWRAYQDFGVALADYRGAVKVKGEA